MSRFTVLASLLFLIVLSSSVLARSDDGGGVCGSITMPHGCPVSCFRPDPVCGVDGVTYWCGCPDASCAGIKVASAGSCQLGNGGAASVPGQALLLVHIVWLILLGFSVLFGLF